MIQVLAAFGAGILLGAIYFSTLWVVVARLSKVKHPLAVLLGTGLIRITVLVLCMALISDGSWERLLMVLAGLAFARFAATRWTSAATLRRAPPA